jgi:hypothetical protein
MKRVLIAVAVGAILVIPSIAGSSIDRYKATGFSGTSSGLEFNAKFRGKHPKKVLDLEWFNVACAGGGAANADKQDWSIRVNDKRKFHKTHTVDGAPNQTVTITGQFQHHNHKVPGTFKLTGPSSGCSGGLPTAVDYLAHN